jgi:hypothetical protein
LTPGVFGEIDFRTEPGYSDFRLRDGEAFAGTQITGQTRSNSFVGEWIPGFDIGHGLNIGYINELGTTHIYYVVNPELMVQYDHLDEGSTKALIFSTSSESLRVGPQINLQFLFDSTKIPADWPDVVRYFLAGATTSITNHESWDEYSGREYSWTQVSITWTYHDLRTPGSSSGGADLASHFGVTASYGYGNAEATGTLTNQVKVGLAVKF